VYPKLVISAEQGVEHLLQEHCRNVREQHDVGGIHGVAESFAAFLLRGL